MPPVILYVGGSHPQRRAVRGLVNAGFEVHVTDRDENPPCSAETAHTHRIDATDVDGILNLARHLQKRGPLIAAYGIGDYAFRSVTAVNRLIGGRTPPSDAVLRMVDKAATKEALSTFEVPMARTLWAGRAIDFEMRAVKLEGIGVDEAIVKPVGVNQSRGVSRVPCHDSARLREAVAAAGRESEYVLIEEFVAGDICNFDAIVINGELIPISMTYRIAHDTLPFLWATQIQPRWHEVTDRDELLNLGRMVASALRYDNGPITIDYIRTAAGPRVIEVSPHLHSIGLEIVRGNGNPLRAWFRFLASDTGWREDVDRSRETAGGLITLRAEQPGTLIGVAGEDELQKDPRCVDYWRRKPDGSQIASVSAAGGLIAVGWVVGGGCYEIECVAREYEGRLQPVYDPQCAPAPERHSRLPG